MDVSSSWNIHATEIEQLGTVGSWCRLLPCPRLCLFCSGQRLCSCGLWNQNKRHHKKKKTSPPLYSAILHWQRQCTFQALPPSHIMSQTPLHILYIALCCFYYLQFERKWGGEESYLELCKGFCPPSPGCSQAEVWVLAGDWQYTRPLLSSGWCHIHHWPPVERRDPPPPPLHPPLVALALHLWWKDSLMHKVFTAWMSWWSSACCYFTANRKQHYRVCPSAQGKYSAVGNEQAIQHNDMVVEDGIGVRGGGGTIPLFILLSFVLFPLPISPSLTCSAHHFVHTGVTIVPTGVEHILQQQSMRCVSGLIHRQFKIWENNVYSEW